MEDLTAPRRRATAGVVAVSTTRIVVNGRLFEIAGRSASHDVVVSLAFGRASRDCSVAFRHGPPSAREGLLAPGRSVDVVDDEVFNVALAVRS